MRTQPARISALIATASAGFALALAPARAAETEQFRSVVPQKNVDGFVQRCREGQVADASCWCLAKALNETKDGALLLDMVGAQLEKRSAAEQKAEVLRVINRHNLRTSEVEAAMARGNKAVQAIGDRCA